MTQVIIQYLFNLDFLAIKRMVIGRGRRQPGKAPGYYTLHMTMRRSLRQIQFRIGTLGVPGGMPVLTQHFARRTLLQL
jgi:hypothetical protein